MVGFVQPDYQFDEDSSTAQVCFTYTGDLGPEVSASLELALMDMQTEGAQDVQQYHIYIYILLHVTWLKLLSTSCNLFHGVESIV